MSENQNTGVTSMINEESLLDTALKRIYDAKLSAVNTMSSRAEACRQLDSAIECIKCQQELQQDAKPDKTDAVLVAVALGVAYALVLVAFLV